MNIMHFSMPKISYFSPFIYETTFLNHIIYSFSHVFVDQKFMAIFSILFGASTILYLNSLKRKGFKRPFWFYFLRNTWLWVIGFFHYAFIWEGDVLMLYASCSLLLYFLRNYNSRLLLILGFLIYFIPSFSNMYFISNVKNQYSERELSKISQKWYPDNESIQKELDLFRGNYDDQVNYRLEDRSLKKSDPIIELKEGIFLLDVFCRALGMMIVGIALFNFGVLSNLLSRKFYLKIIYYGFGIGIPISLIGLFLTYQNQEDYMYLEFLSRIPNNLATPFISFGYIGIIKYLFDNKNLKNLFNRLGNIGKMALSCYLIESIIATFIFYGFGFGFFGYLSRFSQILITFLIWSIILLFSSIWLKKFQYGPVEWIWRCLTHFRLFPLIRK